ncbi:hypothetical protein L286_06195 [Sphingobium sp. HDIP04]|nr:hypothetical protein L286_06195 [Sphingobium sp. HDIP04]
MIFSCDGPAMRTRAVGSLFLRFRRDLSMLADRRFAPFSGDWRRNGGADELVAV